MKRRGDVCEWEELLLQVVQCSASLNSLILFYFKAISKPIVLALWDGRGLSFDIVIRLCGFEESLPKSSWNWSGKIITTLSISTYNKIVKSKAIREGKELIRSITKKMFKINNFMKISSKNQLIKLTSFNVTREDSMKRIK